MEGEKAKLLCSFGGEFKSKQGKVLYVGGKTRLVSIDRSASFLSLLAKMSEICDTDPIDVRFQLPDSGLDSRLISIENDDDVRNMMEEFDASRKIPIFLFTDKTQDTDDDEISAAGDGMQPFQVASRNAVRETSIIAAEDQLRSQSGPTTYLTSSRKDFVRNPSAGRSMSEEIFRRDSQSLVVGQEYEDVQTFRNALTSAAIAANFELHMIRSDQRRVTARCAAEGCIWRVHASKLPHVSTFRIRTLTPEHICDRSEDAGHRQATAKWIANCIRDKLRNNLNYRPREILNDIYREYGVLITYKRAFLGREKALEELRSEPIRNIIPVEDNFEALIDNSNEDGSSWGEIHDPPRKRRIIRSRSNKQVRALHCTQCNQIGHNRRTCTMPEPL